MSHQYISNEQVNLDVYPALDLEHTASDGTQITLGDLHGNAVKLLYSLTRHGFVDITSKDYTEYVRIYRKHRLQAQDLKDIDGILSRIQIKPEAKKSLLRLEGDVLADRGMNDYFTLKILKKLRDNQMPYEALFSNHDAEFIKSVEKKLAFNTSKLGDKQANSAYKLHELINRNLITRNEVVELYETSFKPALKALSYSFNESQDKITIYSHGIIGLNNIEHIARALEVPYFGSEPMELARTIDAINHKFSEHVAENSLTDLLNLDKIDIDAINGKLPIDEKQFPLAHLIWNRSVEGLIRPEHIIFVHGHEMSDKSINNIINLDNDLGKDLYQHKGLYNALFSREIISLQHNVADAIKASNSVEACDEPQVKSSSICAKLNDWIWGTSSTTSTPFYDSQFQRSKNAQDFAAADTSVPLTKPVALTVK